MISPQPLRIETGRVIGEKYRLEELLGEGATGRVFRAVHLGWGRSFAIKLLKTAGPLDPASVERFHSAALALGRLRHPNIVNLTDSGVDEAAGGVPYLVTELLEGHSLADLCRFQGPQALPQALPLLRQIAAGLDAAHDAGVLHRDLKPGNVFVCSPNQGVSLVKVLDFGLAGLLAGPDSSGTGPPPGTPQSLAPELIRRGQASRSSDIYSFGVLAYETLSGNPPFRGTVQEILSGHLNAEPPPLSLPSEVWRTLRETLSKDPALRPGTAGEVVRRLQQAAEAERASRRAAEAQQTSPLLHSPAAPRQAQPAQPAQNIPPWAGQPTRESSKPERSVPLVAAVLGCVVLAGALGFLIGRASAPSAEKAERVEDRERAPISTMPPAERAQPHFDSERRAAETRRPTAPSSPGVTLGFNDIESACGDLAALPNYLCLVNRGSDQVAGGARLVIDESLASFRGGTSANNAVSINIEGKQRYSLDFGPPKGKALTLGLYTGATRWPFNAGPNPGIDATVGSSGCNEEDGQFRILEIQLTGDNKLRRFVADFETNCNGAIGRVAVGAKSTS